MDHRKWSFVAEKPGYTSDFYFFKICRYGYQKIRLEKPNSTQPAVCKILKNMRYRRNKVEKIRDITKSPFSLVFQLHLFFRNFFFPTEFGLERWSFDDHFDIKNTLTGVFITKGHFQWSILIWAQNAFCKCFLESKIFKIYFTLIKYFTCLS